MHKRSMHFYLYLSRKVSYHISKSRDVTKFSWNTIVAVLALLVFTAGCSSPQNIDDTSNAETIFGRLSQRFQLGSTEEVIAQKLPVGPFFATVRGEVLMQRPAYLDVVLTERESGIVRNDLDVEIDLCQIATDGVQNVESCAAYDGPLYEYVLEASLNGDVYRVDGFEWETDGNWEGNLTITDPATNEVETMPIWPYVYPKRPASSNLFELVSLFLPFVALGIFLVVVNRVGRRFITPVE